MLVINYGTIYKLNERQWEIKLNDTYIQGYRVWFNLAKFYEQWQPNGILS